MQAASGVTEHHQDCRKQRKKINSITDSNEAIKIIIVTIIIINTTRITRSSDLMTLSSLCNPELQQHYLKYNHDHNLVLHPSGL